MLFKIDENLHSDAAELLRKYSHDALTVFDEGLQGNVNAKIADVCKQETRGVITLDLDFSDIRMYPPADYAGIIVLRLNDQSRSTVLRAIELIVPLFDTEQLIGRLWIVDEHQVRVRA